MHEIALSNDFTETSMNKILTAIALTIALPAVAHAQAAPAPKADCCEKMKAEGKECCCKDMAGKDHADHGKEHAGHAAGEHPANQH
jgi:hypothetical protein